MRFATRKQGQGRSKRAWICSACRMEYQGARPKACTRPGCGCKVLWHFASRKELRRGWQLLGQLDQGMISELMFQPRYRLFGSCVDTCAAVCAGVSYQADSRYIRDGRLVVEDVKTGSEAGDDPVFKLKRRWFEACYGIELTVIRKV